MELVFIITEIFCESLSNITQIIVTFYTLHFLIVMDIYLFYIQNMRRWSIALIIPLISGEVTPSRRIPVLGIIDQRESAVTEFKKSLFHNTFYVILAFLNTQLILYQNKNKIILSSLRNNQDCNNQGCRERVNAKRKLFYIKYLKIFINPTRVNQSDSVVFLRFILRESVCCKC